MTRRSLQRRRPENSAGLKGNQSSMKKAQPLSKLHCEKNQLILEDMAKPIILIQTPEKAGGDVLAPRTSSLQPCPLPQIGWGSSKDVWVKMLDKEQNYRHSKSFMQKHPGIQPRMRSILLDWLIEVSEAYALHRQTFYLAQDYFDRFMLTQSNVEKNMLQLVGITCLFIASKMEEACPPKLSQMAYITAGTYYQHEILQMELIILKLYLQMSSMSSGSDLLESQFPQDAYVQMARLLDLCILNINSLDFQYRVLAASVLCYFTQQETVEKVSGLSKDAMQPCVSWMAPFAETLARFGPATPRDFARVKAEDRHNIQTHTDYLSMQDISQAMSSQFATPPNSTEKSCTH